MTSHDESRDAACDGWFMSWMIRIEPGNSVSDLQTVENTDVAYVLTDTPSGPASTTLKASGHRRFSRSSNHQLLRSFLWAAANTAGPDGALMNETSLQGSRQRLFEHLHELGDKQTGLIGPITYPQLAKHLGVGPTTVAFAINSLLDLRRLERVGRRHPGGSIYRLIGQGQRS